MERLIVDTDIVIDATRNLPAARDFFHRHKREIALSVVTLTELHAGFRNQDEEREVAAFCAYFKHYDVNEEVAILAGRFRKRYFKSHNAGVADCLIAATSMVHNIRVVTLNKKHYPMLDNVFVPYKKL